MVAAKDIVMYWILLGTSTRIAAAVLGVRVVMGFYRKNDIL